jgi:hypothetical protein
MFLLSLFRHLLKPFMKLQRLLEGDKYVTISFVIPLIQDVRCTVIACINSVRPDVNGVFVSPLHEEMYNIAVVLLQDFNKRWGDGTRICQETLAPETSRKPLSVSRCWRQLWTRARQRFTACR